LRVVNETVAPVRHEGLESLRPPTEVPAVSASRAGAGFSENLKRFRETHRRKEAVLFFFGGFCFDLLLLERIDSIPMLIHQGSYLLLLSILVAVDHHYSVSSGSPRGFWGKLLHFRHEMIHFLLGTLLNAFLVFYFKAASGLWSLLFMAALGTLLLANELPRFRKLGPVMRVALLSFAFTSYLAYLFPVLLGFLSPSLFVLAVCISAALTYLLWRLYSRWTPDPHWGFGRAVAPALAIQALLLALYWVRVVPPVPLSLKWIGIYHDAQRQGKVVRLLHQRPYWKIWEHGDQTFLARPGDRIFCFTQIFAPRNFRDGLKVRWAYQDMKSRWIWTDAIPLTISGGHEEGWRGIAYKRNFSPGEWKVNIETSDGRDVGNIRFAVISDPGTEPRAFEEDLR
jgi:hypothetical protein